MTEVHPLFMHYLNDGWRETLKNVLTDPKMIELATTVEKQYELPISVYPPKELIFNALNLTPFEKVQVVIVGQDPYHGPGQAHGLAFSVPNGVPLPPSLKNIFKELQNDLGVSYPPSHGCLSSWAAQGVLLLNATLTVQDGSPLSHHRMGWEHFTDMIIHKLSEREDPVIFVLWGKSAQDKCRFLRTQAPHDFILTAPHPSPFSAHIGFFGCKHFSKINELLIQQNKLPIYWPLN